MLLWFTNSLLEFEDHLLNSFEMDDSRLVGLLLLTLVGYSFGL